MAEQLLDVLGVRLHVQEERGRADLPREGVLHGAERLGEQNDPHVLVAIHHLDVGILDHIPQVVERVLARREHVAVDGGAGAPNTLVGVVDEGLLREAHLLQGAERCLFLVVQRVHLLVVAVPDPLDFALDADQLDSGRAVRLVRRGEGGADDGAHQQSGFWVFFEIGK